MNPEENKNIYYIYRYMYTHTYINNAEMLFLFAKPGIYLNYA